MCQHSSKFENCPHRMAKSESACGSDCGSRHSSLSARTFRILRSASNRLKMFRHAWHAIIVRLARSSFRDVIVWFWFENFIKTVLIFSGFGCCGRPSLRSESLRSEAIVRPDSESDRETFAKVVLLLRFSTSELLPNVCLQLQSSNNTLRPHTAVLGEHFCFFFVVKNCSVYRPDSWNRRSRSKIAFSWPQRGQMSPCRF